MRKVSVVCGHIFMENKCLSIVCDCFTSFTRQRFYIVVNMLCSMIGFVEVECDIRIRHHVNINKNFAIGSIALRIPTFALVIGTSVASNDWEIITDGLAKESGNFFYGYPSVGSCITSTVVSVVITVCPVIIRIKP